MSYSFYSLVAVSALVALGSLNVLAAPAPNKTPVAASTAVTPAPTSNAATATQDIWLRTPSFFELGRSTDMLLKGINSVDHVDFSLRRDRVIRDANLLLQFTPSPALLPNLSHIRIYLNDVMMSVSTINKEDLGKQVNRKIPLDPRLMSDFNRIRLEFVGHYTEICEDPANTTLWVNISRESRVTLSEQPLLQTNDLAFFPAPFFDENDARLTRIHQVFAANPSPEEQQAAAILASYFGVQAQWRELELPVLFDRLPDVPKEGPYTHSIVFAPNGHRPAFLADMQRFPAVQAPIVELVDHPTTPYAKVLIIWGRDAADMNIAALALAQGNKIFRGQRVTVNQVQPLEPRKLYDAPNWIPTHRPVHFAELTTYAEQLERRGLEPDPISLEINVPPDLFIWRNRGVPLHLLYRFTAPTLTNGSRLNVALNNQLIAGLPLLTPTEDGNFLQKLQVKLLANDSTGELDSKVLVPALKIGDRNQLQFQFSMASVLGLTPRDHCQTMVMPEARVAIDEASTIDLSGYHHYIGLPDLRAFARSSFPFSRMADLSETLVLIPKTSQPAQVAALLETVAGLSARIGYPAMRLQVTNDWQKAEDVDADLLVLGFLPEALRQNPDPELLRETTRDALLQPTSGERQQFSWLRTAAPYVREVYTHDPAASRVDISASAPMAAIVGQQSPFYSQRSLVAVLATQEDDYQLFREAWRDVGKRDVMAGSSVVIRSSGVHSQFTGERYFVGYLPWWELLWFHLSTHPSLLALIAAISVLLVAIVTWQALQWVARKRLK